MEIEQVNIVDIQPYKNNPRKNEQAVGVVADSIKNYGFLVPVVLDDKNIVVAGHTRIKAAMKLGMTSVPAVYTEGLNDEQIKAFRIMDNKSNEYATWDYNLLKQEILDLKSIDVELTGFKQEEIDFFNPTEDGKANDSYQEWRKSGGIEYGNEDNTGYKTILLHFKEAEDVQGFSTLIKQNITDKTKYLWIPKQKPDEVVDLEYEEA